MSFIAVAMIIVMMFWGTADVVGRYLFNKPIMGTMEWNQMMMAGVVLLCWGYVQATRSNVKLDFFIDRYPVRVRTIINFTVLLITLILFIFIARQSTIMAFENLRQGRMVETINVPLFPFQIMITFGAAIVCLECVVQMTSFFYAQIEHKEFN